MSIPRSEHPRPDFERADWLCLNGEWEFEIDNSATGEQRGYYLRDKLDSVITVPFCPESELSGINNKDFMNCVWYRREVDVTKSFAGKRVILHIGACDYHTKVWVNGCYQGDHFGGYTPFCFDITDDIRDGKAVISVCAYDDLRSTEQPRGKQSDTYASYGCLYTRTTGIWQTVWLEAVDPAHILMAKYYTDTETPAVSIAFSFTSACRGAKVTAEAFYDGKSVGTASATVSGSTLTLTVPLSERHLWEVGCGRLYDLRLTLSDGERILDDVSSYFGLRSIMLDGKKLLINGKSTFMRLVLDQGFYPDGIYTARDEATLKADIEYSLSFGFNGARLHQKVFEPRFLYWCDRLGYIVWGEYASWGLVFSDMTPVGNLANEFLESVERDFNHPAVIGWCPLNEVWENQAGSRFCRDAIRRIYEITVKADPTRLVIDSSGGYSVAKGIYDIHSYISDPVAFSELIEDVFKSEHRQGLPLGIGTDPYPGDALFVSEYGGIGWQSGDGWGYGENPDSLEEFYKRYKGLTDTLLDCPYCFGFCYTQLTDVEQERNGLLDYSRKMKFDADRIKKINSRKAAVED